MRMSFDSPYALSGSGVKVFVSFPVWVGWLGWQARKSGGPGGRRWAHAGACETLGRFVLLLRVGDLHHLHFLAVPARTVHFEDLGGGAGPPRGHARADRGLLDGVGPAAAEGAVLPLRIARPFRE